MTKTETNCSICNESIRHIGPSLLVEGTEVWLHLRGRQKAYNHLAAPALVTR